MRKRPRGNSGNTSVDSMMEDTPANYNLENQRFDPDSKNYTKGVLEGTEEQDMEDEEYASEQDNQDQINDMTGTYGELKKKRRKKKKKKKRKAQEMEDPSLRDHLMANAYGGVAKPKPKRQGIKHTTNIDAGLIRDIATPGSAIRRDISNQGFVNVAMAAESSRGRKVGRSGHSELGGSQLGSKIGKKGSEATSKLLDPQQREAQLK